MDPEGWFSLPTVRSRGLLNHTRIVDIDYTVRVSLVALHDD